MSPLTASMALRIALEDSQTIYFIKTNFSNPEQRPEIISWKWKSRNRAGYSWNVAIVEKPQDSFNKKVELVNIALIEVDSLTGKILKRQFFRNIFAAEFKEKFYKEEMDKALF